MTIVEATISMVVVSLLLIASMHVTTMISASRRIRAERQLGERLVSAMIDEVLAAAYEEPSEPAGSTSLGPDAGETSGDRSLFDDMDDYNALSEDQLTSKNGEPIGTLGWTRQVSVVRAATSSPDGSAAITETGLKRVTVQATSPSGRVFTGSALRARWGVGTQPPAVAGEHVTGVVVEVRVDPGTAETLRTEVRMLNIVETGG